MPSLFILQSNFNLGELNKQLYSRADFSGYLKGMRRGRNVIGSPRGGAQVRFGTDFCFREQNISSSVDCILLNIVLGDETYLIMIRVGFIDIYTSSDCVLQQTIANPYVSAQEIQEIEFEAFTTSLILVQGNHPTQELAPVSLPNSWSLTQRDLNRNPTFDFENNYDAITFTPSAPNGTLILTASSPIFTPAFVGGIFEGNGGILRINIFNSTTSVTGTTIQNFASTAGIIGVEASLREPIFSATRGYAKAVGFTQGRLILAGSDSIPSIFAASKINDYFNFDEGTGLDDEAIILQTTPVTNLITQVFDTSVLMLFGTQAALATPTTYELPFTASNIKFIVSDNNGISPVQILKIDNIIIHLDKGKKIVRGMAYNNEQDNFKEKSLSVLSPQLITDPIYADVLRNPTDTDGMYYFLINTDGTMACYHTLQEEEIGGWTGLSTPGADGKFRHITSNGSEIWFVVERTVEGEQRFFLEKLNFNSRLDMTHRFEFMSPQTTITGLDEMEGLTVRVIADGAVLGEFVVTGGEIELEKEATNVEVGLFFAPEIIPMPPIVNTSLGTDIYFQKRINTVYVDFVNSLGIVVNDVAVNDLTLSPTFFDTQPPQPYDGIAQMTIFNANYWDPRAEILITQKDPYPFHIIGIGLEVQTEGQPGGA